MKPELVRDIAEPVGPFCVAFRRYRVGKRSYRVATLSEMSWAGQEVIVAVPRANLVKRLIRKNAAIDEILVEWRAS